MIIQPTAILMSHLFADAADFSSEDIMKTIPAAPPNIKAHIFTIGIKELYAFVNWVAEFVKQTICKYWHKLQTQTRAQSIVHNAFSFENRTHCFFCAATQTKCLHLHCFLFHLFYLLSKITVNLYFHYKEFVFKCQYILVIQKSCGGNIFSSVYSCFYLIFSEI